MGAEQPTNCPQETEMKKTAQTRYPWKRWLNRRTALTLVRGRDYRCQPHSMAQQCRNAAAQIGATLSIHIDGGTLTIQRLV
jgi:hypothetical protein